MSLKTLAEEWQGFSEMIFAKMNPPPGPVQVEETKRAFFAGAWAFYRDLIKRYAEKN